MRKTIDALLVNQLLAAAKTNNTFGTLLLHPHHIGFDSNILTNKYLSFEKETHLNNALLQQ